MREFKVGDWVAIGTPHWMGWTPDIAKVKYVHDDGSLDLVFYAPSGEKIGRLSEPMGGPTTFDPCCTPGCLHHHIAAPKFPLPDRFWGNFLQLTEVQP